MLLGFGIRVIELGFKVRVRVKFKVRVRAKVRVRISRHRIAERLCEFRSGPFTIIYHINAHSVVPSDGFLNKHSRVHEELGDLRAKTLCIKRMDCDYW